MRREQLTLDDLAEKARLSEIASIDEIRWAVLETNGDQFHQATLRLAAVSLLLPDCPPPVMAAGAADVVSRNVA